MIDKLIKFCAKYHVPWIVKWHYQIEDKPSFSTPSLKEFLKGKSLEELVEIAQMVAIQCPQSTSGKHSSTSFEGSSSAKSFTPV